jgi:hypothetical protein
MNARVSTIFLYVFLALTALSRAQDVHSKWELAEVRVLLH